jgi:hypothetical protein
MDRSSSVLTHRVTLLAAAGFSVLLAGCGLLLGDTLDVTLAPGADGGGEGDSDAGPTGNGPHTPGGQADGGADPDATLVPDDACDDGVAKAVDGMFPTRVSAGGDFTCAIRTDGSVVCWGAPTKLLSAVAPPSGNDFVQLEASDELCHEASGGMQVCGHACGVRSNGLVSCWGYVHVRYGEGLPPTGPFAQVSAGYTHTCGVRTDGTVDCWGNVGDGQSSPPAGAFRQVSAGDRQSCGVRADGSVACWGTSAGPPPPGSFRQVSSNLDYSCGLKTDGTIACWGANNYEQSSPPPGAFRQISAGTGHACAIDLAGAVKCWGLGLGAVSPPPGVFCQVSAGQAHTCGVRSDGSIECWGDNQYGQSTPPAGTFW